MGFSKCCLWPSDTGLPFYVAAISCPDDEMIEPYFAVSTSPLNMVGHCVLHLRDMEVVHGSMSEADLIQLQIWVALNLPILLAFWRGEIAEFDLGIRVRRLGRPA